MSLSSASVVRPVFTTMATLIVVTLGFFSLGRIPVDLMPDITEPVISISTTYENASPLEVEELITKPLERAVAAITGVDEVISTSMEGSSRINLVFDWGEDMEAATNEVRDRIDRVLSRLPDEVDRPSVFKFDTSAFQMMMLAVSSTLHPINLTQFIEDEVIYRLERSDGVATASVFGGLKREIQVEVAGAKVKAMNLDFAKLLNIIRAENLTEAGGDIDRGRLSVAVRTLGEFKNLNELANLVVDYGPGGAPVRLREIASISDSWARQQRITRVNQANGQMVAIFKQSGANTVSVADNVYEAISGINKNVANIDVTPAFDSSVYIRQSIGTVANAAIQGGILALLVILVFLQSVRSTLILGTAIPISIVATFLAMFFWGLTINVLTLGALALGVGMLVDNSIVVLENIFRLRSKGLGPKEAASQGADEVGGAIIASTLTTLAVFVPMMFLTGLPGIMFKPFSWTIVFALVCSLAVALTLVPMLAGQFLHDRGGKDGTNRSFGQPRYGRKYFKWTENIYLNYLHKALSKPKTVLLISFLLLAASVLLVGKIGVEFAAQTDEGAISIRVEMAPGTRVEKTLETVKMVEAIVAERVPERTVMISNTGGGSFGHQGAGNTADLRVRLVPIKERDRSVFEIINDLRKPLASFPGSVIRLRAQQSFFSMGGGGSDKIQVELYGHDLAESARISDLMKQVMEKVPGISDVELSSEEGIPEELIIINRDRVADAHLSVANIASTLKTALGGSTAGNFRENGKEYPIVLSLKDYENLEVRDILNIPLTNSLGQTVLLGNVASVQGTSGPTKVERKDQTRFVTLSADYSGRAMGDVLNDMRAALDTIPLPADFHYVFAGEAKEMADTFQELFYVLLLAIVLVYMVMACQFEQLKGPLVVMFSVPFAAIGVILSHFLTGTTFNINSFIGVIMLAGIVVNNAIILIDHANLLRRRENYDIRPALIEAGRRRLRPILMTTLTTILGLVPLALGIGEGSESQAPLARAVIGGLTTSTFITLFVVPAMYLLMAPKVNKDY